MRKIYTNPMSLRIKTLRKAAGLSQQMLADMAGMSRSQLSEIETMVKPANTIRLEAIAKALNVDVNELFAPGSDKAFMAELAEIMQNVSDEDRETILRMARSLSRQR